LRVIASIEDPALIERILFLVAIAVYDFRTRGRLHPATLWGGLFLVASQPLRLLIGVSAPWSAFAAWLAR
jgi:hypothetical protein